MTLEAGGGGPVLRTWCTS